MTENHMAGITYEGGNSYRNHFKMDYDSDLL